MKRSLVDILPTVGLLLRGFRFFGEKSQPLQELVCKHVSIMIRTEIDLAELLLLVLLRVAFAVGHETNTTEVCPLPVDLSEAPPNANPLRHAVALARTVVCGSRPGTANPVLNPRGMRSKGWTPT